MVRSLRYDWAGAQAAIDRFNGTAKHETLSLALPTAYFNMGRFQQAWEAAESFYRYDPLNFMASGYLAAWSWSLLEDFEMMERYDRQTRELAGVSVLWGDPAARVRLVPMEQAIEDARRSNGNFGDEIDWAPVIVPVTYGVSEAQSTWETLDRWLAEGKIQPAQYWWMLAYTNRVDDFIDLSFQLYADQTLNAPWLLLSIPNTLTIVRYYSTRSPVFRPTLNWTPTRS